MFARLQVPATPGAAHSSPKVVSIPARLTRILLVIVAVRATVPVMLRPSRPDAAPCGFRAVCRYAWPMPCARQAYTRLVRLVRESAAAPSRSAARVATVSQPAVGPVVPPAGPSERYTLRAVGRPRC